MSDRYSGKFSNIARMPKMRNTNIYANIENATSIRISQRHSWFVYILSMPSFTIRFINFKLLPPPLNTLTVVIIRQLTNNEILMVNFNFHRARTLSI